MKTLLENNVYIVQPEFRQVDSSNAFSFGEELEQAFSGKELCLLDLSEIEFVDSSGLGKIVSTLRTARERDQIIVICNPRPAVQVLFTMVRLSQIAQIYPSREEALQSLKKE